MSSSSRLTSPRVQHERIEDQAAICTFPNAMMRDRSDKNFVPRVVYRCRMLPIVSGHIGSCRFTPKSAAAELTRISGARATYTACLSNDVDHPYHESPVTGGSHGTTRLASHSPGAPDSYSARSPPHDAVVHPLCEFRHGPRAYAPAHLRGGRVGGL